MDYLTCLSDLPGKVELIKGENTNSTSKCVIPKLLFQTWKTRGNIPEKWIPGQESIKKWMGSWVHIITDDNDNRNFIQKHYPDYLAQYDSFPHNIQRADFVRPFLLHKFGGLYMDMDIVVQKPLDDLFTTDGDVFLVMSGNVTSCTTNSFMASKKGADFWKIYFGEMCAPLPWWTIFGRHWIIMSSTGPMSLNRAFKKAQSSVVILPSKHVMPCSVCDNVVCDADGAFLRPLEGQSWVGVDSKFYNFVICHYTEIIFVFVVIILLILLALLITWIMRKYK